MLKRRWNATGAAGDSGRLQRLAARLWLAAAALYLGSELVAALAFSPRYSYAHNYISDLGVTVCGTIFDGRPICSPLHAIMNASFILQGVLFFGAALAIFRSTPTLATSGLVAVAALNGFGNVLLGLFPENAPGQLAAVLSCHVLGALLAIVFGNAAALLSVAAFRTFSLPRLHRSASLALPLAAALSLAMLVVARQSGRASMLPDAIWERASVYTITAWEVLTAACLSMRARG